LAFKKNSQEKKMHNYGSIDNNSLQEEIGDLIIEIKKNLESTQKDNLKLGDKKKDTEEFRKKLNNKLKETQEKIHKAGENINLLGNKLVIKINKKGRKKRSVFEVKKRTFGRSFTKT
jgi:hypothetical protein